MKILITGNEGYIGPVLTNILETIPHVVLVGLDNRYFAELPVKLAEPAGRNAQHVQVHKDIRDVAKEDFEGIDTVIHLAALSNDPISNRYALQTAEINYGATAKTALLAREAGVSRFIFASSCSVYGFSESGECDESSPANPLTEYARSKVLSERFLQGIAEPNFKVICFRFATACGASPKLRLDLVLNDFVASALATGKIEILSDGSPWRPLIDVKNMSHAIKWAVSYEMQEPYLLLNAGTNDWNFQIKTLAETVRKVIPGVQVTVNPEGQPDKRSYRVRFDRFEKLSKNLLQGAFVEHTVQEIYEMLKKQNFSNANFRQSEYMRLNVLKNRQEQGLLDSELRWL
jgi:nucleoside-diphosphate-sugar epimerase